MMRGKIISWSISGAFVLWIFFVLASFFTVQKPFSVTSAVAIANVLLDLLTAGWLALLALAMGTWLLQRLFHSDLTLAEASVLGTGLGLGTLGLLSFAVGLAGLYQPVTVYIVTIALSVIGAPQVLRLIGRWRRWRPTNPPGRLTAAYLLLISLLTLPVALLPPTDWDGLFYHLTGPKLYVQAERVIGGVDIPHLNFPSLMEMLYSWAILMRGDIAAKLLHTLFGVLLSGLVYLTARHFLSKKSTWLAVLIFASMPMVNTLAGWAYNDLALAFYQFASLYAFISYQTGRKKAPNYSQQAAEDSGLALKGEPQPKSLNQSQNLIPQALIWQSDAHLSLRRWLIVSGIFAGLAMGLKYTSFVTPVVIGSLILWFAYHPPRFTIHHTRFTGLADLGAFSLATLLVALPWYAKNWSFTGNPVYPFLFGLFGGQLWDSFRANWYAAAGTGIGFRPDTILALPWLLTLGTRDVNYWDGRTGPLLLLFLPLVLFYSLWYYRRNTASRPAALTPLLIYGLAQFCFWTLGVIWSRSLWQSRLLLSGLVALAPVAGWVWADLSRFDMPQFSLSKFTNLAVGLTLVLMIIDTGLLTLRINPLPYLVGLETRDEYLTRRLGAHYATIQRMNETLPLEATVAFLWEPRTYYCQRDCRPDSILAEFPQLVYEHGSADAIAQTWQQRGVTHVLVHRSGLDFMLRERREQRLTAVLTDLERNYLHLLFDVEGAYQVYALRATP